MKIELVDNWRQFYRWYSTYGFLLMGLLPDLWNLAVKMEVLPSDSLPAGLSYTAKVVMFGALAARMIKQEVQKVKDEELGVT